VGIITRGDIARAFFNSYHNISLEYDTIINSTHNLIISVDEKGLIRVWNVSAERLLGRTANEVSGKNILDVLPNSGLMDIIETGKSQPLQKIKLNDRFFISNRSPILKEGKIIGAVAVLQDISEIEKISLELEHFKELTKELDAIIDSSFDGLYITDGNGLTLRVNKAYERINNINANLFLGKRVEDIKAEGLVSESVTVLVLNKESRLLLFRKLRLVKQPWLQVTRYLMKRAIYFG
jgi:transcriptional regulator with PAS, ATPase and Fis domain